MKINLTNNLLIRLQKESAGIDKTIEERILEILDKAVAPENSLDKEYINQGLDKIKGLLTRIPCVNSVATSNFGESFWWLKFSIDIKSAIAWTVVQELGHILNYLSVNDKLPTIFYPASPPPYMNGGPEDFLSWVIEPTIPFADTNIIFDHLHGRLPEDYDKEESWRLGD